MENSLSISLLPSQQKQFIWLGIYQGLRDKQGYCPHLFLLNPETKEKLMA